MIFCDAHLHLSQCDSLITNDGMCLYCVSSCHNQSDYDFLQRSGSLCSPSCVPQLGNPRPPRQNSVLPAVAGAATAPYTNAFASFGIHPQEMANGFYKEENKKKLEILVSENKITAIGEFGFDFFTPELKQTEIWQSEIFEFQLNLALKFQLPVVLHLRKSIHKVFEHKKELQKLPSVIFHSYSGTFSEAHSILSHNINGFFSFGKPVLNGKKTAIDCVTRLPSDRLLLETDAPYQTLRNETRTTPTEIKKIYTQVAKIRNMNIEELEKQIFENFQKAYKVNI